MAPEAVAQGKRNPIVTTAAEFTARDLRHGHPFVRLFGIHWKDRRVTVDAG